MITKSMNQNQDNGQAKSQNIFKTLDPEKVSVEVIVDDEKGIASRSRVDSLIIFSILMLVGLIGNILLGLWS